MGRIHRSPVWDNPRVKPPYGSVEIDGGHPLAQGLVSAMLFNEGAGPASDLVLERSGEPFTTSANPGAPLWTVTSQGVEGDFSQAALGYYKTPGFMENNNSHFSVYFVGKFTTGAARYAGGIGGGASDRLSWGYDDGGAGLQWLFLFNSVAFINSTLIPTTGHVYAMGMAYTRGSQMLFHEHSLTAKTVRIATISTASTPATGGPDIHLVGCRNTQDNFWSNSINRHYFWKRPLTAGEFLWLNAEPYAFLRPIIRRRYFVPSAAAAPAGSTVQRRLTLLGVGS